MLTSIKFKNRISKLNLSSPYPVVLEYINLRNIRINGETRGCSGFIKNLSNGVIVYVNTEPIPLLSDKLMYRYALHDEDYHGGINHWSTEQNFVTDVYKALFSPTSYEKEKVIRK